MCRSGFKLCTASSKCVLASGCCADSECQGHFSCVADACSADACQTGFQKCGSGCIAKAACCTDADCAGPSCSSDGRTVQRETCNANACQRTTLDTCTTIKCAGGKCPSTCKGNGDCFPGLICASGVCRAPIDCNCSNTPRCSGSNLVVDNKCDPVSGTCSQNPTPVQKCGTAGCNTATSACNPPCGDAVGQDCCSDPTKLNPVCHGALVCDPSGATCQPCGKDGQLCCADQDGVQAGGKGTCSVRANCIGRLTGRCQACGGTNQGPCNAPPECTNGAIDPVSGTCP
jgi:hypothetical protein